MSIFFRLLVVVAGAFLPTQAMAKSPLPVPSVDFHKAFLVGDWKPNAPSVVVFKDPFCPYCIKALKNKDELDSVNLFMFWYPIFGEKSDKRVSEFFRCESPVSNKVIDAVLQRKSPDCAQKPNADLEAINKHMYEAYAPSGVPAFYLGGQKVSFAEIKSIQLEGSRSSGVELEWDRYLANRILDGDSTKKKAAIYLGEALPDRKIKRIVEALKLNKEYDWYFFPSKRSQLSRYVCSLLQLACKNNKNQLLQSSQEIALLYGLDVQADSQIIINGRLVGHAHLPNSLQSLSLLIH